MIVYLAGKYSGDVDKNIADNEKTCIELWNKGYCVQSPIQNTAHFEKYTDCSWERFMDGDLEMLSRCDCIVMNKGWMCSKGAVIEHNKAKEWGMPIYYYPELPPLKKKMEEQDEELIRGCINDKIRRLSNKFRKGVEQHGGGLINKEAFGQSREENDDQDIYNYVHGKHLWNAISCFAKGDEGKALNIITSGNEHGKILKD